MRALAEGLERFFAGFGLPVYAENAVPPGASAPYMTCQTVRPEWDAAAVIHARLWVRGVDDGLALQKADEIGAAIGPGGAWIPLEGGCAWLYRGRPFAQRMPAGREPGLWCVVLGLTLQVFLEQEGRI